MIHKRCKASVVTTCPGIRTCFEVLKKAKKIVENLRYYRDRFCFSSSIVKNVLKSMFRIDLLLIRIEFLLFVIIVDHFFGAYGIKECNVEVKHSNNFSNDRKIIAFRMQIECSQTLHTKCGQ